MLKQRDGEGVGEGGGGGDDVDDMMGGNIVMTRHRSAMERFLVFRVLTPGTSGLFSSYLIFFVAHQVLSSIISGGQQLLSILINCSPR